MDAKSGKVLGRVKVGAVPRGIALSPAPGGKPKRAWVLNAVENSLSVLGVSNPKSLRLVRTIPLEDPTHPDFKAGRIAFNNADFFKHQVFFLRQLSPGRTYRSIALGLEDSDRYGRQPNYAAFHHAGARPARYGALPLGRNSG